MILLIDTSTPVCKLSLVGSALTYSTSWEAGRGLALGLLGYIQDELARNGLSWKDLSGLVVFKGPGSFTGLRIGVTVMNTLAYSRSLPIVGTESDDWQSIGLARLTNGEDDKVVLPEYGGDANITTPRK